MSHQYDEYREMVETLPTKWSPDQVALWVQMTTGVHEYADLFRDQRIDGMALACMTKESLKKLGVKKIGCRIKLVTGIAIAFQDDPYYKKFSSRRKMRL